MSAKQITVPLEVYVRLQELASLAAYSYRVDQGSEESVANDKPWDLFSKDGASLLDENGALKPEAAELYFTLLPLIAQEFMEQQQALVDAYRQAPKPAAARAKIRPSNQRLIPLTEVPPVLLAECYADYRAVAALGPYAPDWWERVKLW